MLDDYKNSADASPDMDYFKKYPAPMFEAMFNQHIGPMNSTTPYYGPLMYWLIRAVGALNVMEIGVAQGWSSYFMACGVADESARYGVEGTYYAVDIADKGPLMKAMKDRGANVKFIQKDSLKLVPEDFDNKKMDLIFQDGWHSSEYVMDELALLRPHLKDKGDGYWIMHDIYAWCEEVYPEVLKKYDWESIRFLRNYGLGILRNMTNYDHKKVYWPTGPQKPAYPGKGEVVL